MSLKDRFANHSDTPAEKPQPEEQKSVELYDTAGHARNICFVQADGSMTFLNYAYLVSGEFKREQNIIKLEFTTHIVTVIGSYLESLFESFLDHAPQKVYVFEKRYVAIGLQNSVTVNEIIIEKIITLK